MVLEPGADERRPIVVVHWRWASSARVGTRRRVRWSCERGQVTGPPRQHAKHVVERRRNRRLPVIAVGPIEPLAKEADQETDTDRIDVLGLEAGSAVDPDRLPRVI